MKYKITKISVCIPVNRKQWDVMIELEPNINNDWKDIITEKLTPLGAESIEFDEHFGMSFFFDCKNKRQAQTITDAFETLLNKYIKLYDNKKS